jgi:hypothetical protein
MREYDCWDLGEYKAKLVHFNELTSLPPLNVRHSSGLLLRFCAGSALTGFDAPQSQANHPSIHQGYNTRNLLTALLAVYLDFLSPSTQASGCTQQR